MATSTYGVLTPQLLYKINNYNELTVYGVYIYTMYIILYIRA